MPQSRRITPNKSANRGLQRQEKSAHPVRIISKERRIKNLKGHYRAKLSSRLISALDNDSSRQMKDVVNNVNLLDALYLVSEAWFDVKKETVANFSYTNFGKIAGT